MAKVWEQDSDAYCEAIGVVLGYARNWGFTEAEQKKLLLWVEAPNVAYALNWRNELCRGYRPAVGQRIDDIIELHLNLEAINADVDWQRRALETAVDDLGDTSKKLMLSGDDRDFRKVLGCWQKATGRI